MQDKDNEQNEAAETVAMVQMAKTIAVVFKTFREEGLSIQEASVLTMNMLGASAQFTGDGPDALEDL